MKRFSSNFMRPRWSISNTGKTIGSPSGIPVHPGKVTRTPSDPLPPHIKPTNYYLSGDPGESPQSIQIYSGAEIEKLRRAATLARKMLDFANSLAQTGVTTDEIDRRTHEEIIKNGACPSPINYRGFPKSICSSVNEVVCHGIPDSRPLQEGDMLSIDISVYLDGFHGDNCGTVIVGDRKAGTTGSKRSGDDAAYHIMNTTQAALRAAVAVCKPGACISSIGSTIETIAKNAGLRVIKEFCGHGVGHLLHMQPLVLHFRNHEKTPMVPGMCFTIEPILAEGSGRITVWDDGWTAATVDGGRAAQFEHQVLITDTGAEILTLAGNEF